IAIPLSRPPRGGFRFCGVNTNTLNTTSSTTFNISPRKTHQCTLPNIEQIPLKTLPALIHSSP
ncbi:hypothetical protein, partial [Burkholderia thailandensis]